MSRQIIAEQRYTKLVALGDSITHGHTTPKPQIWTTLLASRLNETFGPSAPQLINAGVGGHTSAEGLARIDKDVLVHLPALVLIEFGGNDTRIDDNRFVSVDGYKNNLRLMHQKITRQGGSVILMTFPPVVNDWHAHGHASRFDQAGGLDQYVQPYRDATHTMAKELDVPCFDLDKLLRDAAKAQGNEPFVERDGVHLTAKAHALVADALAAFLRPMFTRSSHA